MSNQLYPKGKEAFITGAINMSTDNIKCVLVNEAYNAADQFLSDVVAATATSGNLGTKTVTNGVFDSADVVFTSVGAGPSNSAVVMYKDTGTAGTSNLIAFIDTATGLPVTPDGTNITVEVNASGWFTL